jgi:hypothetical protein
MLYARGMPVTCSICAVPETARIINEMLARRETLDKIAAATGKHRSSVARHKTGSCPFSFLAFKAARVKSKGKVLSENSRLVVCWPPEAPGSKGKLTFMENGRELTPNQITAADELLIVRYNRPLLTESLLAEAYAENAERFAKLPIVAEPS